MRAFVGIPIACPAPLAQVLEELRACGADLKVVAPENLHVTLKFLGEIPEAQAEPILARLRAAGMPVDYSLEVRDVGAFPDWKKFNVVWAGLKDQGELARSFALSEKTFAELGFPVEGRPFSPHVTVARKRSDRGKDSAKRVLDAHRNEAFGAVQVRGPVLFRSHLGPQGPTYERLGEVAA